MVFEIIRNKTWGESERQTETERKRKEKEEGKEKEKEKAKEKEKEKVHSIETWDITILVHLLLFNTVWGGWFVSRKRQWCINKLRDIRSTSVS